MPRCNGQAGDKRCILDTGHTQPCLAVLWDTETRPESYTLCGQCGAITSTYDWTGLDRDPHDEELDILIPSTGDPSFWRCPACNYLHTDDDSDPGVWEGNKEQMEAERERQILEGYEYPDEAPSATLRLPDE